MSYGYSLRRRPPRWRRFPFLAFDVWDADVWDAVQMVILTEKGAGKPTPFVFTVKAWATPLP